MGPLAHLVDTFLEEPAMSTQRIVLAHLSVLRRVFARPRNTNRPGERRFKRDGVQMPASVLLRRSSRLALERGNEAAAVGRMGELVGIALIRRLCDPLELRNMCGAEMRQYEPEIA